MTRAQIAHPKILNGLCIGLGLLLVVEMFGWLLYLVMVDSLHEGFNTNTMPALTGPLWGPSTVQGYGVPSKGRDVSGQIALLMAVLDFCAVFGLAVRSVAVRSRAFTATAVAHALLLTWMLVLGVLGYPVVTAVVWLGLIVGYCAAIRRVAPVLER